MNFENDWVASSLPYAMPDGASDSDSIIKLDSNEAINIFMPDVLRGVNEYIESEGINFYFQRAHGASFLLKKLSSYVNCGSEYLQLFAGSDAAHECIIKAFLQPSSLIISPSPTYDNFRAFAEVSGAIFHCLELSENQGFECDSKKLMFYIKKNKPKLVYICNPNNPTCNAYNSKDLLSIVRLNSDVLFVIDEAYFEFTLITMSIYVQQYDNLIITRSFSKAFGLAALRLGYVIACPQLIKSINKVRNKKSVSSPAISAGIAALSDVQYMQDYVSEVKVAREYFTKQIASINCIEKQFSVANFILLKVKKKDSLCLWLKRNGILVRNLSHFQGLKNYLRITIGPMPVMRRVFEALLEYDLQCAGLVDSKV